MKSVKVFSLGAIIIVVTLVFLYLLQRESISIFRYDDAVWSPYISGTVHSSDIDGEGRDKFAFQENGLDYVNFYTQGCSATSLLYQYHKLKKTRSKEEIGLLTAASEIIDSAIETFERNGKFPRPQYKEYSYGWVSSMDAPTLMVASEMLHEITGEKKYEEFVKQLITYTMLDVKEGGYNIFFKSSSGEDAAWPLEYAATTSTLDNSYLVLNGSLVGYLGMRVIAEEYQNPELMAYLDKVKLGYKEFNMKYHYEKYFWTYYMLNPKTVIPPHYIIFEKELYAALFSLEGDTFWQTEEGYRENALFQVLGLQFMEEPDGLKFICRRACTPHPYLLDIYTTQISFYDKDNNLLKTFESNLSGSMADKKEKFYEGEFLYGSVPENAIRYELYSYKNSLSKIKLFSGDVRVSEPPSIKKDFALMRPKADLDAKLSMNKNVFLLSSNLHDLGEGRFTWHLQKPEPLSVSNYYAMEIDNLSAFKFNIGLRLYDSEGKGVSRYYTPLVSGKNLILFSELGFDEIESIKNISDIVLRIYTDETTENVQIAIGEIHQFSDLFALKTYIDGSPYKIMPQ